MNREQLSNLLYGALCELPLRSEERSLICRDARRALPLDELERTVEYERMSTRECGLLA